MLELEKKVENISEVVALLNKLDPIDVYFEKVENIQNQIVQYIRSISLEKLESCEGNNVMTCGE